MSLLARLRPHVRVIFDVVGLTLISTGAGTFHTGAGLVAAGVSCLLLSWRGEK